MTGFLKRDLYLSIPFFRLYGVFLVLALFLTARSGLLGRTYLLYIMVLGTVGVQNLFNFDMINAWRSYAAAVPGGRRALVDAHYLTALGLAGAQALIEFFIGWRLGWTGLLHTGFFLLILALMLPAACRFGPRQASVAVLLVLGLAVIGAVAAVAWQDLALGCDKSRLLAVLGYALPPAGLVLLALSWPLSRRIAAKRDW